MESNQASQVQGTLTKMLAGPRGRGEKCRSSLGAPAEVPVCNGAHNNEEYRVNSQMLHVLLHAASVSEATLQSACWNPTAQPDPSIWREWGGGWHEIPFPEPPPPWPPCRDPFPTANRPRVTAGGVRGTPTCMTQDDPCNALNILSRISW